MKPTFKVEILTFYGNQIYAKLMKSPLRGRNYMQSTASVVRVVQVHEHTSALPMHAHVTIRAEHWVSSPVPSVFLSREKAPH